ncbi:CAP domain-containing protein [Sphaerotilus sp.]|uniref:CAP domain-containing protein n=1 Tax=Sphaerotilus sp. TaxID=2093942 RepID=UPI00286E9905|nr:CAP domain-containing protein [Sphaerotilus sp.]
MRVPSLTLSLLSGLAFACTAAAAPRAGERYVVDDRCVTLVRTGDGQASYRWREGNMSGSGTLPLSMLTESCDGAPAAAEVAPAAQAPAPSAQPPRATAGTAGNDAFARDILRAHNQVRCLHGAPPLAWHEGIAAYARNWVSRGGFAHSDAYNAPIGPLGENLYGSSEVPTGADAVRAWYGEVSGYRPGDPSGAAGHFTALIWKDVRYLGCARAGGNLFCNYWSGTKASDCTTPNMQGCYREQVLPRARTAAQCP